ncbi:hypothetical protein I4U23_025607 [Adineta vaga]|nr:hypothetical protein I4U23_025607 [Adineta vaga]
MGCCCGKSKAVSPTAKSNPYKSITPQTARPDSARLTAAPAPEQDYSALQRFTKIGLSPTNPLQLIQGYQKEPLGTLEEALQPVDSKIDHLSHYVQEAKTKCHFPSEHGLTRDESAAIYIYTMKWNNRYVNDQLHKAWASGDQSQIRSWFRYLKLLKTALDKLPTTTTGIWQGTNYDERLNEKLSSSAAPIFTQLASCAPNDDEIRSYLQKYGGQKTMLVSYEAVNGKNVTGYTASKSQEIIMWPGMKLGVSKYAVVDANGSVVAHLVKKIEPPKQVKIKRPPSEKHFVCPNPNCGNRCRGNHKPQHCYGFSYLVHHCHHHCGPVNSCARCYNDCCDLRQCHKCENRFCDKCCLK